eukprot:m51a1_g4087 putative rac-like gtp-binding protein arac3 (288) ;mRNA; f:39720-40809
MKCVFIGDDHAGKTALIFYMQNRSFQPDYVPTIFDSSTLNVVCELQNVVDLHIYDTAGHSDYEKLRSSAYSDIDVAVICFSTVSRKSFDNVTKNWLPELRAYSKSCPAILVGTKIDRRCAAAPGTVVTYREGVAAAKKQQFHCYVETSSRHDGRGVMQLRDAIARVGLRQPPLPQPSWVGQSVSSSLKRLFKIGGGSELPKPPGPVCNKLTAEGWIKVMLWLSPRDLGKLAGTCKAFKTIAYSNDLWGLRCKELDPGFAHQKGTQDREFYRDNSLVVYWNQDPATSR